MDLKKKRRRSPHGSTRKTTHNEEKTDLRKSSASPRRRTRPNHRGKPHMRRSSSSPPSKHRRKRSRSTNSMSSSSSRNSPSRTGSDDTEFCLYSKIIEENRRLKDGYRTDALLIHLVGKLRGDEKMIILRFMMEMFPDLIEVRDSYIRNYSPRFQNVIKDV